MSERALRIARRIFVVDGLCLVVAFFVFVDLGGDVRGAVHDAPLLGSLLAIVIWSGPLLIYGMKVRTAVITILGGLAMLGATGALLVVLFLSQGSTAGIGVVMLGLLLYAGVGTLWYMDSTALRLAARASTES